MIYNFEATLVNDEKDSIEIEWSNQEKELIKIRAINEEAKIRITVNEINLEKLKEIIKKIDKLIEG